VRGQFAGRYDVENRDLAKAPRRPLGRGLSDHLRDAYGPLAARGPGLARYVQSCALPQGYAKGELLFDAIGEM
jgi:hypothetical protein